MFLQVGHLWLRVCIRVCTTDGMRSRVYMNSKLREKARGGVRLRKTGDDITGSLITGQGHFHRPGLSSQSRTATMERVRQLAGHFKPTGLAALERKHPDDVVITMAIRSPLCKAKKGGFRDARYVA
jgi:hypothetical protein